MSNTFFQGGENFFSGETEPPAPLLVTVLILGNDFFVFHKFALPSTFFLPYRRSGVPEDKFKINAFLPIMDRTALALERMKGLSDHFSLLFVWKELHQLCPT